MDVYDILSETAGELKKEAKSIVCCGCRKVTGRKETKYCSGCGKSRYCTVECQVQDWSRHKERCRLIKELRTRPGYNDRMPLSRYMYSEMYQYGRRYLSQNRKGAVCFRVFPWSKKAEIESKLESTTTSATMLADPIKKCVYHFFILPLSAMADDPEAGFGGFDEVFRTLCANDTTYRHYIPVIRMSFDEEEDMEESQITPEVKGLSYYMVCQDELP